MSIIEFDTTTFDKMLDAFAKTLTHTPVTKTTSNITGDETLTNGTPTSISGVLFKRDQIYTQAQEALIEDADAVLQVKVAINISKNDKIEYDGDIYRIDKVLHRRLGTSSFYKFARMYKNG